MVQFPVLPPSATSRQHKQQPQAVSTNISHKPSAQTAATSRQHKQSSIRLSTGPGGHRVCQTESDINRPDEEFRRKEREEKYWAVYPYNTHYTCVCPCVPLQHSLHLCLSTHRVPLSMCLHTVCPCNTRYTCVCPMFYTPCTPAATLSTPVSVHVSTHRVPLQHSLHLCLSRDYTPCTPATLTAPAHVSTHRVPLQHSLHLPQTPSTGLRHPSFLGGRCWKAVLGVCTCPCTPARVHTVYRTLQHSLY